MLVFLDLVSSLLIQSCFQSDGRKYPEGLDFFQDKFEFHIYVSFADRDSSIGLDLIEALESVNKQLGLSNFKATIRLSKAKTDIKPRWTPEYVKDELTPMTGQIQKVWVCGPPAVNEMFDKTLANLSSSLGLNTGSIEIM